MPHQVKASDFASLQDVAIYHRLKSEGFSEKYALAHGDNGIGFWGDTTAQTVIPMVALPPDDIIAKFGAFNAGHNAQILLTLNGKTLTVLLCDHMPWKKNIHNGAGIDCNPAVLLACGEHSPMMAPASWDWKA